MDMNYDALLVVSFGGPESREEVIPFLETVLRGRNVPRERLLTVAEHYYHFEGKSPINGQVRDLIAAIYRFIGVIGIGTRCCRRLSGRWKKMESVTPSLS
jgi:protoheme ferro-lyase